MGCSFWAALQVEGKMSWDDIYRMYGKLLNEQAGQPPGHPLTNFILHHRPDEMPDELNELTVQALEAMAEYDANVASAGVLSMSMAFAARSAMLVTSLLHSAYLVGKQGESQQQDGESSSKESSWEQAFEELSRLRKFQNEFKEEFPDVDPKMGESICRLRLFLESNYDKQACTEHHSTVHRAFDALFDYLVQGVSHPNPADLTEDPFLQVTWHLAGAIFSSGYTKGRTEK